MLTTPLNKQSSSLHIVMAPTESLHWSWPSLNHFTGHGPHWITSLVMAPTESLCLLTALPWKYLHGKEERRTLADSWKHVEYIKTIAANVLYITWVEKEFWFQNLANAKQQHGRHGYKRANWWFSCSAVKAFLTFWQGGPSRRGTELHSVKPGWLVGTTRVLL